MTEQGQVDIFRKLQEALVEKIREVPATELETIREYIREVKELETLRGASGTAIQAIAAVPYDLVMIASASGRSELP